MAQRLRVHIYVCVCVLSRDTDRSKPQPLYQVGCDARGSSCLLALSLPVVRLRLVWVFDGRLLQPRARVAS